MKERERERERKRERESERGGTVKCCFEDGAATCIRGGNIRRTSEMSDTNTQATGSTETEIVKMSDDPPLVKRQNDKSIHI